nr:E3 ubiquitin-protein ligase TRIP12 [Leptinotarsa decemlineata]
MADPANTLAAASTSRRKRVLPTQPRAEAKRLRTSSQEDSSPDKKSQHNSSRNSHKNKSGKSGQSQEKKSDTSKPSTHQRSRSQEVPSTSSTSNKDRNSQIPNSKSKKHSKSDRDQAAVPEFEQKTKRNSRHSLDLNNHKQDPVDIYFRLNNSEPSGSSNLSVESRRSSRKNRKRSNSKDTREDEKNSKVGKSNSLNNIKIETNQTEKTERSHRSHRKRSSSGFNSKNNHLSNEDDNPEASTSSSSSAFSQVHKYPLRSHSRTSVGHSAAPSTGPSVSVHLSRKSLPERGKRELLALGASSSQPTTRDAQEPSRLTRSGAVLRRSTRSSKGHSSTTGSCASSSGASGSGSSSRRAARQQKVGSAAPALLSAPATHAAAAMSADQPEVPNNGLSANDEPSSPQEAAQAVAPSGGGSAPAIDSESDDSEVGRLQALLEARGLPPHLFSALGPRMQQMLHRSMGTNNSVAKAQALIPGLQAIGDEGQQLQAVIEMCQILVMGNEEILTGFPVKQVVPPLTTLLGMEHNFDIMNHACRALTYMMEALPRSSAVVVDAVPVFLEKLQVIQCMDVAEQSLTALDMLSRRHSKAILLASVCLAFSRLVDSFHQDPAKLQEIASTELLTNLQQLLVVTPPIVSTGTFITVLRMLSVMCANCPDLALTLLKQNIAETLVYLLTGSAEINQDDVELIPRQPQEQFEITALIGELMPKLPTEGIFAVDSLLERPSSLAKDQPIWQWREDRGLWHTYSAVDSRIIEAAHMNGDDEVSLNSLGKIYTIDFHSMQQINEDTGTSRPVQRRFTPTSVQSSPVEPSQAPQRTLSASRDARVACLREERGLAAAFIRSLFSVLYEVYSSSAGPAVRFKCLRALLRMVYYANSELLRDVLKNQVVSSHIAGMMASSDLRIVVGALQMAEILMTKLPDEFGVHFRREGVLHQINRLADPEVPLGVSPPKSSCSSTSFSVVANESQPSTSQSTSSTIVHTANGSAALLGSTPVSSTMSTLTPEAQRLQESDPRSQSPSHVKFSDVLKRKRVAKRTSGSSRSKTRQEDMPLSPSLMQDLFTKATSIGNSTPSNSARQRFSGSSSKSSFLQSLNPARWGRSMNTSHDRNYSKDSLNNLSKSSSNSLLTAGNREKTRTWIREQASKFIESYSSSEDDSHSVTNVISRLKVAIDKLPTTKCGEALLELREILMESDISPFEVNYSGLITALLSYLADEDGPYERDQRLRIMLNVFAGCPFDENVTSIPELNPTWMSALVNKLNGCVSQLEQFPVKVHDFPASSGSGRGGTSALKFFNTHQLKCNLQRHPECTNLKQWKGGTVKIDPLALVQAIERYLVVRGYGRLRDNNSADSDDGDSDTDIEESLAGVVISQTGTKHKLQFLIGNNVLPYNMTVYQAVRQFSNNGNDQSETDTDNETPLGHAGIWVQTHVISYRPMKEESTAKSSSGTSSSHSSRKGKGSSGKSTSRRKGDELWNEGITPPPQSPLTPFLMTKLPETVTIKDASLEVLCLLRILNSLNVYWSHLYPAIEYQPILPPSDFLNSKIAAKASRQLQDPLVIMTGNLPNWLQQIAMSCPFLFPFETRQLLFYATSFDRDRALQRLLDMSPELGSSDSQERVTPRLDRRKRTISREEILKQAEQVMQDMASSKALLEVQYENEVGTGLGPTLEFYALVSKEMQRSNLELWNAHNTSDNEFVHSPTGLFPIPLSRGAKVGQLTKVKSKFRFLGKFMAKAVMDSRMLDLPFSLTFYRWLLGQEHCLTLADLKYVSPEIYKTLRKMQLLVKQRDEILVDPDMSDEDKNAEVEKLEFDGCPIEDLGLDFIIPGHNIDLMKNGRSTHLTIHNLHLYVKLMSHWILHEGVSRQMESLREGKFFHFIFCFHLFHNFGGYSYGSIFEIFVVSGFKSLSPPLTVVRKTLEANMNPDDYLPSVMTCVNYLKLPEYSSIEVMREKLRIAASEGQHSFYLS